MTTTTRASRRRALLPLLLVLATALAACGTDDESSTAAVTATTAMTEDSMMPEESMAETSMADEMSEESMADEMSEDSMMSEESMVDEMSEDSMIPTSTVAAAAATTPATAAPAPPAVPLAAWQTLPLVDTEGVTFTLGELVGTPTLVEAFATWCSKCRAQLVDTNAAAAELGEAANFVALSVETDLDPADITDYAADNGFSSVRFALATPELLAALVDAFGTTIANPPGVPKFVVAADGTVGELSTGAASVESLRAALGV